MMPRANTIQRSPYPAQVPHRSMAAVLPGVMNEPPSFARYFVEFLFYFAFLNSMVIPATGLGQIRFAGAAPQLLAGVIALSIFALRKGRKPMTLLFVVLMYVGATLSDLLVSGVMPVIGGTNPVWTTWVGAFSVSLLIVENVAARKRYMLFIGMSVLIATLIGGVSLAQSATKGRLQLEETGVIGAGYADANAFGYAAAIAAVSLLFWSLRSAKTFRPVLWCLGAVLMLVVIRTVSRGAIVAMLAGLGCLFLAILGGRGVRLGGFALVVALCLAAAVIVPIAEDSLMYAKQRFGESSRRTEVYSLDTAQRLLETVVLGEGAKKARTSAGIYAHNSYINTQLIYGGITSFPYLAMIMYLGVRVKRMLRAADQPLDIRFWVLALYGMSVFSQLMQNMGYVQIQSLFAFSMIEGYTAQYSRAGYAQLRSYKRLAKRRRGQSAIATYPVTMRP